MATRRASAGTDERPTRAYRSPLREQRAAETRARILAALAAQVAQPGRVEISVPEVARDAGVSTRTVYQHLPDREAQLAAVAAWIDGQLSGTVPLPRSAEDLPSFARATADRFLADETLARAQVSPGLARVVRRKRRQARLDAIDRAVHDAAPHDDERPRWAAAIIKHLLGADTAIPLVDEMGLDRAELGAAIAWAVQALVQALDQPGPLRTPD